MQSKIGVAFHDWDFDSNLSSFMASQSSSKEDSSLRLPVGTDAKVASDLHRISEIPDFFRS